MDISPFFFYLFASMAIACSLLVILKKSPVASAFSLVLVFFAFAGIYALLDAHLIAALQVLVYAGAIMVLFVFVIMLLNMPEDEDGADRLRWLKFGGIPLGLFFLLLVLRTLWNLEPVAGPATAFVGSPQAIGRSLFTDYVLPFEVTSLLILIALVGAVVFAKKDL